MTLLELINAQPTTEARELAIKLAAALADVVDGNSDYDMQQSTGYTIGRCEEICQMGHEALNLQAAGVI
jgi:hypothetical protein